MEYPREIGHGITFHHFHNAGHPKGQGSISQDDFEAIIHFVGLRRILNPLEWLEKLGEEQLAAEDVCLTFDDALLCQFEIALPVLEKYHRGAFWLVYSSVFEGHLERFEIYRTFRSRYFQHIDEFYDLFFRRVFESEFADRARALVEDAEIARWMEAYPFYSVNDVRFRLIRDRVLGRREYERMMDEIIVAYGLDVAELAKDLWMGDDHLRYLSDCGHVVGLHSYSHPMTLAGLSYEEQLKEYERNFLHIKRVCRHEPVAMSHPANSYGDDTLEILERLGIRSGFRANMVPRRPGTRLNPGHLELARQDHANIMRILGR